MKIREIRNDDILEVAKLYNQLAYFIRDNSADVYFDFDKLRTTQIEAT